MPHKVTVHLEERVNLDQGKVYKVVADAASSGYVTVHADGGGAILERRVVAAGSTEIFGPFGRTRTLIMHADVGTLTYDTVIPTFEALKYGSTIKAVTGSTYTLSDADHGYLLDFQAGCTVTVPKGLRSDFSCGWSQAGASPVVFAAAVGVTLQSGGGLLSTGGQFNLGGIAIFGTNIARLFGALA